MVTRREHAGFPRSLRLRTRGEFKHVFQQRCSVASSVLVVYAAHNDLEHCRLGLVVSRKVGVAVVRNKWKRVLREAFRHQRRQLPPGLDLVVLPRVGSEPQRAVLERDLVQLAHQAARKVERKRANSAVADQRLVEQQEGNSPRQRRGS